MRRESLLLKLLFKPVSCGAARRALVGRNRSPQAPEKGRFTAGDVDCYVDQSWLALPALVADVQREPTFGSRMNVRLAALTLAMLHTLTGAGIERQYAIELIGDTAWTIYQYWGRVGGWIARLWGHRGLEDTIRRVRPDGSWPMSFPFNPPGYRARSVPAPGGLGFDVIRCPVADLFRRHGAGDLGVHAWCRLDYPLAEMLRLKLVRSRTLAAGDPACDFRWWPADNGKQ